jgi:hypothetical protein
MILILIIVVFSLIFIQLICQNIIYANYQDSALKLSYSFDDAENIMFDNISENIMGEVVSNASIINDTKRGNVLKLDTGYVSFPTTSLNNAEAATFAFWFKVPSDIAGWSRLFEIGETSSDGISVFVNAGDLWNGIRIDLNSSISGNVILGTGGENRPRGVLSYMDNTWNHFALVINGTTAKVYLNGDMVQEKAWSAKPLEYAGLRAQIGKTLVYGDAAIVAEYDDFKIYNKELNENQLATEYNFKIDDFLTYKLDFEDVDNLVSDTSGLFKNSTAYGSLTQVSDNKIGNYAVEFSGDDYIQLSDNLFKGHQQATVSAWVKITTPQIWSQLFSFCSNDYNYWYLSPNSGNAWNEICAEMNYNLLNPANYKAINNQNESVVAKIIENEWVHISISADGDYQRVFFNGIEVVKSTCLMRPSDILFSTLNFIGKTGLWSDSNIKCLLDDFRIYAKALTSEEIISILPEKEDANLVSQYSFDNEQNYFQDTISNLSVLSSTGASIVERAAGNGAMKLEKGFISLPLTSLKNMTEATFMMWFKFDQLPEIYTHLFEISTKINATDIIPRNALTIINSGKTKSGMASVLLDYSTVNNDYNGEEYAPSGLAFPTDVWCHIALSIDGSGVMSLMLNGKIIASAATKIQLSTILEQATGFYIGGTDFNDSDMTGYIDDFRVYDKALTLAQIDSALGITQVDAVMEASNTLIIPSELKVSEFNFPKYGENGTLIKWESSNSNIINVETGNIIRQAIDDIDVNLVATISRGATEFIKTFQVRIMAMADSSEQIIDTITASDINLSEGYLQDMLYVNKNYLMKIDNDKLLVEFRRVAGLEALSGYETPYGGWIGARNSDGIVLGSGNFLGHYLSALSLFYAAESDNELLVKANDLIIKLREIQLAYAEKDPGNAGYLSGFDESVIDNLENSTGAYWVPYYFIHKTLSGLYDSYILTNNEIAKTILIDFASWISNRINNLSIANLEIMLRTEFGGMNDAMYNVYRITKDAKYLETANRFNQKELLDAFIQNNDILNSRHANTDLAKIVGYANGYDVTGDENLKTAVINAFNMIAGNRTFVTGNTSNYELWGEAYDMCDSQSMTSHETCCGYNLLKIANYLYTWTGNSKYMDFYERVLFNSMLPSMDNETGLKTYYISMESGYSKVYHSEFNSFWCCTGTGVETFSKFNQNIYHTKNNNVSVDMFISSTLNWKDKGVKLIQNSNFPESETSEIRISEGSGNFTILIRKPYWTNGMKIYVNGVNQNLEVNANGYFEVTRDWIKNDTISVNFPMTVHTEILIGTNKKAIMYGPVVLAGDYKQLAVNPSQAITENYQIDYDISKVDDYIFIEGNLADSIKKGNGLNFTITAKNQIIKLLPFYKIKDEFYGIYWDVLEVNTSEYDDYIMNLLKKSFYSPDEADVGAIYNEAVYSPEFNCDTGFYKQDYYRYLDASGEYMQYSFPTITGVSYKLALKVYGTDVGCSYQILWNGINIKMVVPEYRGNDFTYYYINLPAAIDDISTIRLNWISGRVSIYRMWIERLDGEAVKVFDKIEENEIMDLGKNYIVTKISFTLSQSINNFIVNYSLDGSTFHSFKKYNAEAGEQILSGFAEARYIKFSSQLSSAKIFAKEFASVDVPEYNLISAEEELNLPKTVKVNFSDETYANLPVEWTVPSALSGETCGKIGKIYNTSITIRPILKIKKINDGLIVWYSFDEQIKSTVTDMSGNGNDGVLEGGTNIVDGKYGTGIKLDGKSGAIKIANNLLVEQTDITVSMWVKYDCETTDYWARLFDLGNSNYFFCLASNGHVNLCGSKLRERNLIYKANTWYNYTLVIKGKVAKLFINGCEVAKNEAFTHSPSEISANDANYIGLSKFASDGYLNAIIDEFKIYNYAFNYDEVLGLYKSSDGINFESIEKCKTNISSFDVSTILNKDIEEKIILPEITVVTYTNGLKLSKKILFEDFDETILSTIGKHKLYASIESDETRLEFELTVTQKNVIDDNNDNNNNNDDNKGCKSSSSSCSNLIFNNKASGVMILLLFYGVIIYSLLRKNKGNKEE